MLYFTQALIDVEVTNSPILAETTFEALKKRYESDPQFNERLRLIGMRTRENFQAALSNYDLLAHMKKGNFVFHEGGWAGEQGKSSMFRRSENEFVIEFENIRGRKDLSRLQKHFQGDYPYS